MMPDIGSKPTLSKQSKHLQLDEAISNLTRMKGHLEDFVSELAGDPIAQKEKLVPQVTRPFMVVIRESPDRINEICDEFGTLIERLKTIIL